MADETTQEKEFTSEDEKVHIHVETDEGGYRGAGGGGFHARERAEYVADQVRTMAREVVDGMLRRVPPDVVEHLNNSRKELLLAFRGMIDRELDAIDKCTRRAHDLHKESKGPCGEGEEG